MESWYTKTNIIPHVNSTGINILKNTYKEKCLKGNIVHQKTKQKPNQQIKHGIPFPQPPPEDSSGIWSYYGVFSVTTWVSHFFPCIITPTLANFKQTGELVPNWQSGGTCKQWRQVSSETKIEAPYSSNSGDGFSVLVIWLKENVIGEILFGSVLL